MTDILKERRLINLNSEDATFKNNGTFLSDVVFAFSNILKEERNIIYVEGGVLNAQIPVSFYAVNYTNHVLYYSLSSTIFSITVPVGNYNFTTFATALEEQFLVTNGHIFNITIDQTKGIVTFDCIYPPSLDYFQETDSTIWRVLGFETGSGDFLATGNLITPPYLLNLLGVKKLKIFCESFSVSSCDSKNYSTSTLIDTISVDVPSYGQLNYANITGEYGRLKRKEINNIDIQIKDENNNLINFNNTDWSITLAIIIFRKVEIVNNDLQPLINSLGNIENLLSRQASPLDQPTENFLSRQASPLDKPLEENAERVERPSPFIEDVNTGFIAPTLETDDLDLLLYENPNLFK